MPKHNRTSKKISGICSGYCCDKTMKGLQHWYKCKFEKLGWMVLAKERGMYDKIGVYKNSLMRLKKAIEKKIASVHEADRKDDLRILHKNLMCLIDHVEKDFA